MTKINATQACGMNDHQLLAALDSTNLRIAEIVSSIHGILDKSIIERRDVLQAEAVKRNLRECE